MKGTKMKFEPVMEHSCLKRIKMNWNWEWIGLCFIVGSLVGLPLIPGFWISGNAAQGILCWLGTSLIFSLLCSFVIGISFANEHNAWSRLNYKKFRDGFERTYGVVIPRLAFENIAYSIDPYEGEATDTKVSKWLDEKWSPIIKDQQTLYRVKFVGDQAILMKSVDGGKTEEEVRPLTEEERRERASSSTTFTLGADTPVDGGDDIVSIVSE